jgi:ubiquinol-cytochrome c reductase cytochrome c subunit
MSRRAVTLIVLSMGALLSSCQYLEREVFPYRPPAAKEPVGPETGRQSYLADCAWCHANRGQGTKVAPPITDDGPAGVHFMLTTGRMPIDSPAEDMKRRESRYDAEEIEAIVEYSRGFSDGPEIPEVDTEQADLSKGAELYLENCAACHSTTGIGGALTSGDDAPDLHLSTPVETAEAMVTGPGEMPVFGPDQFDDEELNSIVAYVTYLQSPNNRGGSDLGGAGPVTEGAVGLLVGVGAVMLVIRWIGTRAHE